MAHSHGTGRFERSQLASCAEDVVIEPGVLIFHPETIELGPGTYVGHNAILKGYYNSRMVIGRGVWIGQQCFLHSAGGIHVADRVGIGPGVRILSSTHDLPDDPAVPIMDGPLSFAAVALEEGCDIGVSAVILPGVTVGRGAQIGAGAVVTRDIPPGAIAAGVPARVLRYR